MTDRIRTLTFVTNLDGVTVQLDRAQEQPGRGAHFAGQREFMGGPGHIPGLVQRVHVMTRGHRAMIDDSPNFIARHCANLRAVAGHLPIGGELTMLLTKSADLIDRMREGAKAERERLERENANLRAALLEQGDELKRLREVIALHEQVSSQEVSRG